VLKCYWTVLSAIYTCAFSKIIFGKYCSFFFLFFFFIFLCVASGLFFCLFGRCGCFVRTFLIQVRTGVLVRSLTWHYVRTALMFRPDGEPCRVKSHSPVPPTLSFHSSWFFVGLCFFVCSFHVFFSCALVLLLFLSIQVGFSTILLFSLSIYA